MRPACTALGTVVCEDVHQRHAIVGSGSRENVQTSTLRQRPGCNGIRDIATVHETDVQIELK